MAMPITNSEAAFADSVRPHLSDMWRLACRLVDVDTADDIVQDALLRAWAKWDQYDEERGSVGGWLMAITTDRARRFRTRRRPHAIVAPRTAGSEDERIDLEAVVARLSPRQKLAVDCYYFVGLSVDETAAVMGCSSGTVKSTLADARERLREALQR